jgi:hypothetical protein
MIHSKSYEIIGTPLEVKKVYPIRVGFLNDIHVGSQFGLFPEGGWTTGYGGRLEANEGQKIIIGYLNDYAEKCNENKVNHLWIPGDLICGSNYKEAGTYVNQIELEEQKEMAARVIADFCAKVPTIERIFIWRSTGYHGSRDSSVDLSVARILKSKYGLPVEYKGEYSIIDLVYNEYRKKIFITHPTSNATMYPEQAMGKDMLLWEEAVGKGKLPHIDVIIRAHKHNFLEVHKATIRAIQLACWQFFVPYDGAMKNFARWQPDVGSVILLFDEKLRMTTFHYIYDNILEPRRFIEVNAPAGVQEKCLL